MMKKILFIIYNLDTGGVNSSLSCLYSYIKGLCDVRVFSLNHEGNNDSSFKDIVIPENKAVSAYYGIKKPCGFLNRLRFYGVKVLKKICVKSKIDFRKIMFYRTRKTILKYFTPDIVVAFQENDATLFASTFEAVKKITWVHFDYSQFISKNRNELPLYSQFNHIVCVSKYTAFTFKQRYPSLAEKVTYIYNLLDEKRIRFLSKNPLKDEAFKKDSFTILSAGRISPEKGFSTIPKIAKFLKDNGCCFRWYIIGREDKPKELANLKKEIDINQVTDCLSWIGAKTNPYPYFVMSDLYVSTSFTEACPMVFNEARVLGVPIVSTNFGSSYEFIKDGVDGFITKREDMPLVLLKVLKEKDVYNTIKKGAEDFQINDTEVFQQIEKLLLNKY